MLDRKRRKEREIKTIEQAEVRSARDSEKNSQVFHFRGLPAERFLSQML
jgi:hypothetical protein